MITIYNEQDLIDINNTKSVRDVELNDLISVTDEGSIIFMDNWLYFKVLRCEPIHKEEGEVFRCDKLEQVIRKLNSITEEQSLGLKLQNEIAKGEVWVETKEDGMVDILDFDHLIVLSERGVDIKDYGYFDELFHIVEEEFICDVTSVEYNTINSSTECIEMELPDGCVVQVDFYFTWTVKKGDEDGKIIKHFVEEVRVYDTEGKEYLL